MHEVDQEEPVEDLEVHGAGLEPEGSDVASVEAEVQEPEPEPQRRQRYVW